LLCLKMSAPSPTPVQSSKFARQPEPITLLSRLWRSTWMRAILTFLLLLVAFLAVFYPEENWRGKRAWEIYRRHLAAKGVVFDWRALAPEPVSDTEDLCKTAFFAPLFDYMPGTYTPRDLKAYNRVAGFAQTGAPYSEARRSSEEVPPMFQGRNLNLADGLRLFQKTKGTTNAESQSSNDRRADAVALLGELNEFQSGLAEIQAAVERPNVRFNLGYKEEYTWRVSQPHLPLLKRVSRLLAWRASAELAVQNPEAAAEDVLLILAVAQTIGREPLVSSFLARNVVLDDARQIIWEGLAAHDWSDAQLKSFEAQLQGFTLQPAQTQMALERASINSYFEMVHKDPGIRKGWNFGTSLGGRARGFTLRHMPPGWMYLEQISYHRMFDAFVLPADNAATGCLRPHLIDQAANPAFPLWGHRLFASPVLNSSAFILTRVALSQTGVNEALLACALERYRLANDKFPERLDDLGPSCLDTIPNDVVTGNPMKYRRTAEGKFVLYSFGRNEKDDAGKPALNPQTKAPDWMQGDWVWPSYPEEP
jgi:hypothetical protein